MLTRYALIGSGHRAQMYLDAIAGPHADVAELVALLDINPARLEFHRDRHPAFADVVLAGPDQLEDVIRTQRVDRVIVTSVDRLHAEHVVRSLEAGADVIVEKPLTIDAPSARAIQDAIDRTGRSVVVTFNYRYSPRNTALKQVIAAGEIGEVVSVTFEWVLDVQHGADYFRRWHREKINSGGLFIHKAAHHFDLVNWWIADTPARVYARGGLRFYGADAAAERGRAPLPERGTHDGSHDPFELDLRSDERLEALYLRAEQHDGYQRDRSVFDAGITTEDNLTAIVDYAGGPVLTYALTAHSPWEGYRVAVGGTRGRAELEVVERAEVIAQDADDAPSSTHVDPSAVAVTAAAAGARQRGEHLVVQTHFEPAREVEIPDGVGGHGGGDALLLRDVFVGPTDDELGRPSDHRDGLRAISVGICGNESLATGGPVDVADFLGMDLARAGHRGAAATAPTSAGADR
ncbi:MAG: Gfo/Idh/MocA family oxidoreductase [Brachybacterium sp.]|uniref:Gfo/Idh/MocA family protein n=1 Tax=Brachybacterium sp. TaxID=1891286 RepID=UPI0026485C51|nr:Gfo/Idh/MocA family oxidoreductase [Brachybacterium sp.]MDN5688127.1 Gfo/Idh/MocA family oxidoreductase [Brachybacterium sp.]